MVREFIPSGKRVTHCWQKLTKFSELVLNYIDIKLSLSSSLSAQDLGNSKERLHPTLIHRNGVCFQTVRPRPSDLDTILRHAGLSFMRISIFDSRFVIFHLCHFSAQWSPSNILFDNSGADNIIFCQVKIYEIHWWRWHPLNSIHHLIKQHAGGWKKLGILKVF